MSRRTTVSGSRATSPDACDQPADARQSARVVTPNGEPDADRTDPPGPSVTPSGNPAVSRWCARRARVWWRTGVALATGVDAIAPTTTCRARVVTADRWRMCVAARVERANCGRELAALGARTSDVTGATAPRTR